VLARPAAAHLTPLTSHLTPLTSHLRQVEESFQASEGAQLGTEFKLDKHIGSGSTADVFKLKPAKGSKSKGPAQVGMLVIVLC
jgi:hypothetical protein